MLYEHDMQEMWDSSISPHIWNQYHNQLDIYLALAKTNKRLDILDVGCAQGTLALLLAEAGHNVCAVDLRGDFLEYAKSRYTHGDIKFIRGNVLELELDRQFDLIFANQIIEHLVYPEQLVRGLEQLLRPGGKLIVTTPNGDYIRNSLPSYSELGDPSQYEDLQFTADGDGHFFAYLDGELKTIFKSCGLINIKCQFFETPFISGHMKVRYLHHIMGVKSLKMLENCMQSVPYMRRKFSHQLLIDGQKKQ